MSQFFSVMKQRQHVVCDKTKHHHKNKNTTTELPSTNSGLSSISPHRDGLCRHKNQ
jgi:hypothetical protein